MTEDERFMAIAIRLAELGRHTVEPNPMVGSVVVKEGRVLGRGWHRRAGGLHAEIIALHDIVERGGTLYTTLEPCSTWGKTPPCSDQIISSGLVRRVVIASLDRNPLNAGRSRAIFEGYGLSVSFGVLEKRAVDLNRKFFSRF